MSGLERTNLLEDGARREGVAEAEEVIDAVAVEIERMFGKAAERGDLGREGDAAPLLADEQRLDPDGIAREDQPLLQLVPNGDGKHAFEPVPRVVAPAQIGSEDRFRIAVIRLELVAGLELAAQLRMIEDLAVVNDRVARVGAED